MFWFTFVHQAPGNTGRGEQLPRLSNIHIYMGSKMDVVWQPAATLQVREMFTLNYLE